MRQIKGKYKEITTKIDEKDIEILNLLIKNGRERLVRIARDVGLSIDPTKKRIKKLVDHHIIERFSAVPNIEKLGYNVTVHVYLRLKSTNGERYEKFIQNLKFTREIVDVFSTIGEYDMFFVVIGKSTEDIDTILGDIRNEFSDIISEWKGATIIKVHKLEEYEF